MKVIKLICIRDIYKSFKIIFKKGDIIDLDDPNLYLSEYISLRYNNDSFDLFKYEDFKPLSEYRRNKLKRFLNEGGC